MKKICLTLLAICAAALFAAAPEDELFEMLSAVPPGEIRCGTTVFSVKEGTFPLALLAGSQRDDCNLRYDLVLPENTRGRTLRLLHAFDSCSRDVIGKVKVVFADGTSQSFELDAAKDCADFRGGKAAENAVIAYRHPVNAEQALFGTGLTLRRDDPKRLSFFITAKRARWVIAAVTVTEDTAPLPPEGELVIRQDDPACLPIEYVWGTQKDSPLDFSAMNDAPAGKYGFVRASGEEFSFENAPAKRIRFAGTNLVYHACFPEKEVAEKIADELARTGCNLVRIHLNDEMMIKKDAVTSLEIDPEKLDRMEYLVAKLKERGIYITLDLYGNRCFRAGDGAELFAEPAPMAMKYVYLLRYDAMENLKEFSYRWLTHVNPYTGLAWNREPALAFINLLNEDDAESVWRRSKKFSRLFIEAWKREAPAAADFDPAKPPVEFWQFLNRLQQRRIAELWSFVKNELKLKVLVTSHNSGFRPGVTRLRENFDLVDNHQYYAHPRYSAHYSFPWKFGQRSNLSTMTPYPAWIFPTRIYGKPFVISEYHHCFPNVFRTEGGPVLAAYASLQNYAGLVHYRWASDSGLREINDPFRLGAFAGSTDPIALFSNRIISLIFRRGLVAPAKERFAITVPQDLDAATTMNYNDRHRMLGIYCQIGSGTPETGTLSDKDSREIYNKAQREGKIISSTGEIMLDSRRQTFIINAPAVWSGVLSQGSLSTPWGELSGVNTPTSVTLIAMDEKPVRESVELLLFHLTDVTNSDIRFTNGSMREVLHLGRLPLLLKRGKVQLKLNGTKELKIEALGCDGRVLGTVPVQTDQNGLTMKLDNTRFGGVFVYRLSKL